MRPFKLCFFITFLLFTHSALADHNNNYSIFYSYESNSTDSIAGIGSSFALINPETHLGSVITTSLNGVSVLTTDGYREEYASWEGGVRLGYFSKYSFFVEGGLDLSEAIFHSIIYDDDERPDNLDAYIGAGAGVKFGLLKIEAFGRFREIDSSVFEAKSTFFSGIQFSLNF